MTATEWQTRTLPSGAVLHESKPTATLTARLTRADLTLYLVQRPAMPSRLALGRDNSDRTAQDMGTGNADTISVTPLGWGCPRELSALLDADSIGSTVEDVAVLARVLGVPLPLFFTSASLRVPGRWYAQLCRCRDVFDAERAV